MKFFGKILTIIFLSINTISISFAQDPIPSPQDDIHIQTKIHLKPKQSAKNDSTPTSEERIFTAVSKMPEFPGGVGELLRWIGEHVEYPPTALENNIQGRVVLQFVVTKDGSIGEVKVVRSVDPDLDNEAVRVAKSLPKFIPGELDGEPVNVWYALPINFKLPSVE